MSDVLTLNVSYVVFVVDTDGDELYAVYDDEEDAANIVDFLVNEGSEAHYEQTQRNYPKVVVSETGEFVIDDSDTRH